MNYGKKVWIFPDAELPPVGENLIPGHESIIITNTGDETANIRITLLYTDKEPVSFMTSVNARRVRCLRTNEEKDFGPFTAQFEEQYALVQNLAGKFREETGSIVCREILKNPPSDPNPSPRTAEYYAKRPCARMVMTAARILDAYMAENPPEVQHG